MVSPRIRITLGIFAVHTALIFVTVKWALADIYANVGGNHAIYWQEEKLSQSMETALRYFALATTLRPNYSRYRESIGELLYDNLNSATESQDGKPDYSDLASASYFSALSISPTVPDLWAKYALLLHKKNPGSAAICRFLSEAKKRGGGIRWIGELYEQHSCS